MALTLLGPPPEPLTLDVREILQMRAHESKPVITEPIIVEVYFCRKKKEIQKITTIDACLNDQIFFF